MLTILFLPIISTLVNLGIFDLYTQSKFSETEPGLYLDATLTGVRIRRDYANGEKCLNAFFDVLDSAYLLHQNLTDLALQFDYIAASPSGQRWEVAKNAGLLMS